MVIGSDERNATRKTVPEDIVSRDLQSFRDGNQIVMLGVDVNNPKLFQAGMAILYVEFSDGEERKFFLERRDGVLEAWEMDEIRRNYGESILFFGDIVRRARRIRNVGLDPGVVNAGILVGRKAIVTMVDILKENGIDTNVIRRKSIKFRFDNDTGNLSLVSIRAFTNSDSNGLKFRSH